MDIAPDLNPFAAEAANDLLRSVKLNGDDKQLAAGLGVDIWRKLSVEVKELGCDPKVVAFALAWALKYEETLRESQ